MDERIERILQQIRILEVELREVLLEQRERLQYRLDGTRVVFERAAAEAHRRLQVGLWTWLRASQWRNLLSAPVIYAMIVPFVLLDLSISAYQHICFRLYRIPRVARHRYVVIDRQKLAYLNSIEKLNCIYCGYANGVIAYARQVAGRTEQYWCPIRHARHVRDAHEQYLEFVDYGDAEAYHDNRISLRKRVSEKRSPGGQTKNS